MSVLQNISELSVNAPEILYGEHSEASEAAFDHARHLLLAAFIAAICAGNIPPDLIADEIEATASAMRQLASLEFPIFDFSAGRKRP